MDTFKKTPRAGYGNQAGGMSQEQGKLHRVSRPAWGSVWDPISKKEGRKVEKAEKNKVDGRAGGGAEDPSIQNGFLHGVNQHATAICSS